MTLALGLRKILHSKLNRLKNMSKYSDAKELAGSLGKNRLCQPVRPNLLQPVPSQPEP